MLTSKPGHHQTALQSLPLSVGLAPEAVWPLDALRKQRHLADYSGDTVPESAAAACLQSARMLQQHVRDWLRAHHPELMT